MFRVIIADDEPPARAGVRVRLEAHPDMTVVAECGDGAETVTQVRRHRPDLLFLDVEMPGASGFEALSRLEKEEMPLIIFLTAYGQYALQAFEIHAVDYLLKPIDDERFDDALAHARAMHRVRVTSRYATRFATRRGGEVVFVPADDVDWIEATGDYAALHTGRRTHLLREPLHKIEQQLDPAQFVRVHRSAIVRINRIAAFRALANRDGLLRLVDGTEVRVSRTYRDRLGR